MGIRDKPIAPGSPWQNGFAERLIGSIRRECVDHVVALGEAHLRRILQAYALVLQRSENAPLVGQRCTILAPGAADRSHHVTATPRRIASPLHASLSFRYTQGRAGIRASEGAARGF